MTGVVVGAVLVVAGVLAVLVRGTVLVTVTEGIGVLARPTTRFCQMNRPATRKAAITGSHHQPIPRRRSGGCGCGG